MPKVMRAPIGRLMIFRKACIGNLAIHQQTETTNKSLPKTSDAFFSQVLDEVFRNSFLPKWTAKRPWNVPQGKRSFLWHLSVWRNLSPPQYPHSRGFFIAINLKTDSFKPIKNVHGQKPYWNETDQRTFQRRWIPQERRYSRVSLRRKK